MTYFPKISIYLKSERADRLKLFMISYNKVFFIWKTTNRYRYIRWTNLYSPSHFIYNHFPKYFFFISSVQVKLRGRGDKVFVADFQSFSPYFVFRTFFWLWFLRIDFKLSVFVYNVALKIEYKYFLLLINNNNF